MKKLVLSVAAALALGVAGVNAQVTATFKVDMTDFINGGGTINQVVSIAGNFADRGGDIASWSPPAGAMTEGADNMWSRTIAFSGANVSTDSLMWKYIKGADWGDGDEGGSWDDNDPATALCTKKSDFHNRKLLLPQDGSLEISSKWAKCHTVTTGISTKLTGLMVTLGPNPATSELNIRFGGSAGAVITLMGVDGRVVKTITTTQTGDFTHTVNVSDLNAGMYYVTVVDGNKGYKAPVVIVK